MAKSASKSPAMSLLGELKRRNVFRVGAAYVVTSWLVIQVVETIFPAFGFGIRAVRITTTVLAIGLIPTLVFAWAFELTPEGLKKESEVDRFQSATPKTGKKLDRVIMAMLALALGYFAFDKFVMSESREATIVERARQEGRSEALVESYGDNSIAVLAFDDMSAERDQEYLSDGVAEELLNLLAKIPELRVISRSSAFSFKNKDLEIPEIARRLNVNHILEGSVRKSGNRVRITAQLIEARSDTHLWAETYDRTLEDVFVLQEEIAGKITAALLPQIIGDNGVAESGSIRVYDYTPRADVYQRYLLARSLFNKQNRVQMQQALDILTPLVRENPDYAEAQALYAHVMFSSSARTGGDIPWIIAETQVKKSIKEALELNPALAEAHLVEGRLLYRNKQLSAAMDAYERAIALSPSYADAHVYLAEAALQARQEDRVWASLGRAKQLDPLSPSLLVIIADAGMTLDRPDATDDAMEKLEWLDPEFAGEQLAALYFNHGKVAQAALQLEKHRAKYPASDFGATMLAYEYGRMGLAEEASALSPRVGMLIAAQQGREAEALEMMEEQAAQKTDPHDRADVFWMGYYALGYHDRALEVLSDLWHGYAQEQLGPRMDSLDVAVFGMLLREAGRTGEAQQIAQLQRRSGTDRTRAATLVAEGKLDEAMSILMERADKGDFDILGIRPFPFYPGLDQHPGYPKLVARAEDWRRQQYEFYQSLKSDGLATAKTR